MVIGRQVWQDRIKVLTRPVPDSPYQKRRNAIAQHSADALGRGSFPPITYTEEEHLLWRRLVAGLSPFHQRYALNAYLNGVRMLSLPSDSVLGLSDVNTRLSHYGFAVAPVPGMIDVRSFWSAFAAHDLPSTAYLRDPASPSFSTEPDMFHEVWGHAPFLTDQRMRSLFIRVGNAVLGAPEMRVPLIEKILWFTVETGVVYEDGKPRAAGASLLTGLTDLQNAFEGSAKLERFDVKRVLATDLVINELQGTFFTFESIDQFMQFLDSFAKYLVNHR